MHTPLGRVAARLLIVSLIIQPLWAVSQQYHWDPAYLRQMLRQVIALVQPDELQAATFASNAPHPLSPASLAMGVRVAKTADGHTPAEEDVCDGLSGALFGLCNAYCEAMDCDSAAPHASATACSKTLNNYLKKSGGVPPPCVNTPPVADAGPDQSVLVGQTVHLDGSGSSDVDGDALTYVWTFLTLPPGSNAILSDPATVMPTFQVDQPGTYTVELMVHDGTVASPTDSVSITTQNSPPVADAGPDQSVVVGQTVQLNGSASSDVDGDALTYFWSFITLPPGSSATLSDPTAVMPTFLVDQPGTYTVELLVHDGTVDSLPDSVSITTRNSPPVADAGPDQTAFVTDTVQLDGSASSDVDGDPLTYQWSLSAVPTGSTASLSDPTLPDPTFDIDLPGPYVAQLIVNDGTLDSQPAHVTISTQNSAPVANAGPDQEVSVGDTVHLDGSASHDVDGDVLSFEWAFLSVPTGSNASLSDTTVATPSFVADVWGTYVAQLTVNDGTVDSSPDAIVTITVNTPPVADAGPEQTVGRGTLVSLDGSGSSDTENDPLSYQWTLASVPAGSNATLTNATTVSPSFVADVTGTYEVRLTVHDGTVGSAPDTVNITAISLITVPSLLGLTQAEAETVIVAFNLTVGTIATVHSQIVPAGRVVQQSPPSGTQVPTGTAVGLTISLGPAVVDVPDVVGLAQADAEAALVATNLVLGTVTTANSDTVPAGQVISQAPTAGTTVVEGTRVDLVVSLGPVNQPPVAQNDTYSLNTGVTLNIAAPGVLDNDSDPEGAALSAVLTGDVTDGTLTLNADGSFTYTYDSGFNGSASFTYQASDGVNQSDSVTVILEVGGAEISIVGVDTSGMNTDPQTLEVTGSVQVTLQNQGTRPFIGNFGVMVFEDQNGNGVFDSGVDNVLGATTFSDGLANGATTTVQVAVSGSVLFRDNLIYAYANSAIHTGQGSQYQPPIADFEPFVKWQWDAATSDGVRHPPLVAPLIDTNGDGLINERDVPAVIVAPAGNPNAGLENRLVALRGDTGAEIFSVLSPDPLGWHGGTPAVGDIDRDGLPEILMSGFFRNPLFVFNNDGTLKWSLDDRNLLDTRSPNVVLADLDADGQSEILHGTAVLNADGTPRPQVAPLFPTLQYDGGIGGGRQVVDLDLDGTPEIVAGPSAWDRDGNFLWGWATFHNAQTGNFLAQGQLDGGATTETFDTTAGLGEAWTAVANLDGDLHPEIIAISEADEGGSFSNANLSRATMWIFAHDGRIHAGPFILFTGIPNATRYRLGPPTVADFDGDGQPEIAVSVTKRQGSLNTFADPTRIIMSVYRPDGTLLWQRDMVPQVTTNMAPPSAAFDFDKDGASELVFLDGQKLYILNGSDGATLFEMGIDRVNDGLPVRHPTIADVDNDGSAEIVIPTWRSFQAGAPLRHGVLVLGDPNGNWRPARPVWNQWQYHITNVNDDASIPPMARNSWQEHNSHRAQVPPEELIATPAPDLTISKITLDTGVCAAGAARMTARIGNGGSLQAGAGVSVNFYDGDPAAGGTVIGSRSTTQPLFPGGFEDVSLDCTGPIPQQLFVAVNEAFSGPPIPSDNLSLLPHTWAQGSGLSDGATTVPANANAFRGIDDDPTSRWTDNVFRNIDPGPSFYEVYFLFPVNPTSVTVTNNTTGTGFLEGTLIFSNGFSTPMTLDANGQGSVTFAEQTNISWIRLTATATPSAGASLTEFIVGGSYVEPTFRINEGQARSGNNIAACGPAILPCDQGVNRPPAIVSVPPTLALVNALYTYQLQANDPDNEPLSFSLLTTPAGMSIDASTGLVTWTPNDTQLGDNPVVVQVEDARGLSDSQSYTLTVATGVVVPDVGGLTQTAAEAAVVAASLTVGGVTQASSPTVPVGQVASQEPPAGLTVAEGSPVDLVISLGRPPVANTGPDQTVGEEVLVTLDGSASTDPDGDTLSFSWTQTGGPDVVLSNPTAAQTSFTSPVVPVLALLGQVVLTFQLEVSDGGLTHIDTVDITVEDDINDAPTADAGPDRFVRSGSGVALDGTGSSDPNGDTLTFSWTLTSSPAGSAATLNNPTSATPSFTADVVGQYTVALEVGDGQLTSAPDEVIVTAANDTVVPTVSLSAAPFIADVGADVTLTVNAADDQGVALIELTVNSAPVPVDTNGVGIFTSIEPGTFLAEVTILDFAGNQATASTTFRVVRQRPVVQITSPAPGEVITTFTDIIGTVSDGNLTDYTLSVAPVDGDFKEIFRGTSSVVNGVIATFDPTLLQNGPYVLRLSAVDAVGNRTTIEYPVTVAGELKIGNFRLSFTDLTVPVSGIPITIIRTYDTLNANTQTDIGYGWRLEMVDTKLQTSVAKTGFETELIFNPFIAGTGPQGTGGTRVYITTPDGKRQGFTFRPVLAPGLRGSFLKIFLPEFIPDPGVRSKLAVKEVDLQILTDDEHAGEVYPFGVSSIPYNPSNPEFGGGFTLVTEDGIAYKINGLTGKASQISDANGNTLTITNASIRSSTGAEVSFERDTQGRITAVVDPIGNRIRYAYDTQGDLISVTDREQNVTQFVYRTDFPHYLDEVFDPLGRSGVRSEYDVNGRLIGLLDADNNLIEFAHELGENTEITRDALGNPTTFVYDDRGNILTECDALAACTLRTYDANNNMLSELDPLGNITTFTYDDNGNRLTETDPLGNVVTYTYTTIKPGGITFRSLFYSQIATTTDPLGNTTTYTYDGTTGNLLTTEDPSGQVTTDSYVGSNLISTIDGLGNSTSYEYDSFGNMIKEINPLGHVTTYTYGSNGNQLTKTATRTDLLGNTNIMTSTNVYDREDRVVQRIDSDNNTTFIEYNEIGQRSATIDKNANRTAYEYDARGNLVRTIYPDGTEELLTYNANNTILSFTDRGGKRTQFEYDALDRLVRTVHPDGSSTSKEYDVKGRVIGVIDENGNRTAFQYDAASRKIRTIDPIGNVITLTYDSNGNHIDFTDANGNSIIYEYDANNVRTKTIFPDGTFTNIVYDAIGNKISEIDQAGIGTQFEYDPLGRLTKVIDALGNETVYIYDEVGNKLSQTNANGNVTQWTYDNMERVVKRILPLGMSENFTYDPNGNILSKTDFNGQTVNYTYDVNNRLTNKIYPDTTQVVYTYTATDQRETVTTTLGVASYSYDLRDRLIEVINPDSTTLVYTYDANGNRTSVSVPSGTTTYTYDELNRLRTVTAPNGGVTSYTYDNVGNRASVSYPNGSSTSYSYDSLNRLTYLENVRSDFTLISSYTYTLGEAGNRLKVVENTGRTVDYTYDPLYRLTAESITDAISGNQTISYTYDPVFNRLIKTDFNDTTIYNYDSNDRMISEGNNIYIYDDNGNNLIQSDNINSTIYAYDFEDRLISAMNSSSVVEYRYDADGIRIRSVVDGVVTDYLVDKNMDLAQVLEERNDRGELIVSYTYGDDLISLERHSTVSFYHYDGLGSTRALTDLIENIENTYTFEAFGSSIESIENIENRYLFAGEQFDSDVDFYYLRARYYNTEVGRFINTDPHKGSIFDPPSLHKYLYAHANPVNNIDPTGERTLLNMMINIGIKAGLVALNLTIRLLPRIFVIQVRAFNWLLMHAWKIEVGAAFSTYALVFADHAMSTLLRNAEALPQSNPGTWVEQQIGANATDYVVADDFRDDHATSIKTNRQTQPRLLKAIEKEANTLSGKTKFKPTNFAPPGTPVRDGIKTQGLIMGIPENNAHFLKSGAFRQAIFNIQQRTRVMIRVIPIRGWRG